MQIEATYDDGRLEFNRPLRLKHKRFNLVVSVPDDELAEMEEALIANLPAAVVALAEETRSRLDAIRTAPMPLDDESSEPPTKSRERIEAFDLREDR